MRYHQQENNKKLYAFSTFDRQCSLFIKGIAIDAYIKEMGIDFYVTGIQNAELALTQYRELQPTPLEWINIILNAECILTNSFHGVAFSINLQKKFLVILQNGDMSNQNCRYLNLLNKLGLEDRIYNPLKGTIQEQMNHTIDWEIVNLKKNKFILESENFILNALSSTRE